MVHVILRARIAMSACVTETTIPYRNVLLYRALNLETPSLLGNSGRSLAGRAREAKGRGAVRGGGGDSYAQRLLQEERCACLPPPR